MRGSLLLALAAFLASVLLSSALAGEAMLVRDLYGSPTTNDSSLSNDPEFTVIGASVYFSANTGFNSQDRELWKSDGTASGTVRVKNISLSGSSNPEHLTNVGGTLFFMATSAGGSIKNELWKSDGTESGTVKVADLAGGAFDLTAYNGKLFFAGNDGSNGFEPWISDGTAAGTFMLRDALPGSGSSMGNGSARVVNGLVFYHGNDGATGIELWKTDGTSAGTQLVKDINPGSGHGGTSRRFGALGPLLIFAAEEPNTGLELWKSDGTAAGTVLIKDVDPSLNPFNLPNSSGPVNFITAGSTVFFAADDGVNGTELWKTDGTAGGTVLVQDIFPGIAITEGNSSGPMGLNGSGIDYNGLLLFLATEASGQSLWRSDGTAAGTTQVKSMGFNGRVESMVNFGGKVYFVGSDGSSGYELWRTDGTAAGTVQVQDINPGTAWGVVDAFEPVLADLNGVLIFRGDNGVRGGEPWKLPPPQTSAPVIAAQSASGQPGQSLSYAVQASNHPFSFSATGLPSGLVIDAETGVISGATSTTGNISVTVSATNSVGSASGTVTLTIENAPTAAPVITSASSASGVVNQSFSYTILASNSPTSFDAAPLPSGLTLDPTTGIITGTPTVSGSINVMLSATNSVGTGTQTLVLVVTSSGGGGGGGGSFVSNSTLDSDGDGFSDELEVAAFSSSNDASSTPLGFTSGTPSSSITIDKLSVKVNFAKPDKDSISVSGSVRITGSFNPGGQGVYVDVGGVVSGWTLSEKGSASHEGGAGSFKIKIDSKRDAFEFYNAKFSAKIAKGSFATLLNDEGLTESLVKGVTRKIPVTVLIAGRNFRVEATQLYTAKPAKSGKTTTPRM